MKQGFEHLGRKAALLAGGREKAQDVGGGSVRDVLRLDPHDYPRLLCPESWISESWTLASNLRLTANEPEGTAENSREP